MSFIDEVQTRAQRFKDRLEKMKDSRPTEEATKTYFVLPFIQYVLGYDTLDPHQVVPEFTADVGTKKGEKVDYALLREGNPVIMIECKKTGTDLSSIGVSQLHRYFQTTPKARIGILTNGIEYRFFSDIDQTNIMDDRPFFTFNMLDFNEDPDVQKLNLFTKSNFNLESILKFARKLDYTKKIKQVLHKGLSQPSDDFLNFIIKEAGDKVKKTTRKLYKEQMAEAFRQFINEKNSSEIGQE